MRTGSRQRTGSAKEQTPRSEHSVSSALNGGDSGGTLLLGQLATGANIFAEQSEPKCWGIAIRGSGRSTFRQPQPVQLEIYEGEDRVSEHGHGYSSVERDADGFVAKAQIDIGDAVFHVEERWALSNSVLSLSRTLQVAGAAPGGFLSAITLVVDRPLSWVDLNAFAPGMLYGSSEHLTAVAIGGIANYLAGVRHIRIREDRFPAPVFGVHVGDGSSLAVLDTKPAGDTTAADADDTEAVTLVDERFRFGALGGYEQAERVAIGYWFPGTEGEVTYRGDSFPGGQMRRWRRRYHPIRDGLVQRYQVAFRFGRDERFQDFCTAAWRWAWTTLHPQLVPQDIEATRLASTTVLAQNVVTAANGRAGLPNALDVTTGAVPDKSRFRALMGFTGRSVESAYFLLRGADRETGETSNRYRQLGLDVLESFAELSMAPPEAEGFDLDDGRPVVGRDDQIHLR